MGLEVIRRGKKKKQHETGDAGQDDNVQVDNNNIHDHSEQENLEVLDIVDDETNLTEKKEICKDEEDMINEILENMRKVNKHKVNFKKLDQHQLNEETSKVNKILRKTPSNKLTGMDNLINIVQNYIAKNVGLKKKKHVKSKELL